MPTVSLSVLCVCGLQAKKDLESHHPNVCALILPKLKTEFCQKNPFSIRKSPPSIPTPISTLCSNIFPEIRLNVHLARQNCLLS